MHMAAFRGRDVVTALDPPFVEFHAIELPPAVLADEREDATKVVHWEVGRLLNQPVENVETRHWPLPTKQTPGPNAIGTAARRDVVTQRVNVCNEARLSCAHLDIGAAALSRFGAIINDWRTEEIWGVLDLGFSEARLVLCVEDVPVLVRRAGSGGRAWTDRIAESLQLGAKAAEIYKRDHGIALTGRGVRHASGEPPASELASILLSALHNDLRELASEIKRSYEYVLSCYPGRRAADLILVGGGAAMRGLPEFVGGALGIPVRRAFDYAHTDSCRLQYASGKQSRLEVLALAIGLAITL
jgi:type IV pilus assembly protein PilM